jgi:hypothetical protein
MVKIGYSQRNMVKIGKAQRNMVEIGRTGKQRASRSQESTLLGDGRPCVRFYIQRPNGGNRQVSFRKVLAEVR